MRKYSISKVSKLLNVSTQTLRNWESKGLLVPTEISESGYRYYDEEMIYQYMVDNHIPFSFPKYNPAKVFRDPLYGNIYVHYRIIVDLINTKEFQRLRRIRQLSGVSMVFHTAEHSRFSHSIGAYHLANRLINESEDVKNTLNEYEKVLFLVCALLHDIGHGPFSHAFEHVFSVDHETMGCKIIESSDTEIHQVLEAYPCLCDRVIGVINHAGKDVIVESLISSQLDVDRLDYLNRDAFFTGAAYGSVDVDRLIRVLRIKDGRVCYRYTGVNAIENYLMSRYHMYWQVYYHQAARSYEVILEAIYQRVRDLFADHAKIEADVMALLKVFNTADLASYIEIDDAYINGMIKHLCNASDPILKDLCNSFINRHLWKVAVVWDEHKAPNLKLDLSEIEKRYYYKEDVVFQSTYLNYLNSNQKLDVNSILIVTEDGQMVHLEEYSAIVQGLIESGKKRQKRIFYKAR